MILILPILYPSRQNSFPEDRPYAALLAGAALSLILVAALAGLCFKDISRSAPGWGSNGAREHPFG